MSEELKPCAQCGGDAQTDFIEGETYIIECYQCGMRTGWEDSPEDAIAAWNRRAPVAARELDLEAERRRSQTRMGPQGDDPIPAWWYNLHAAAEALADHGCEANAVDVRDIANNLLDQAAPVSTEQAGEKRDA